MTTPTNLRIYANSPLGSGPARPPRAREVSTLQVVRAKPALSMQAQIELEMSRILEAAPRAGESVQAAFSTKERELQALFDSLTPDECTVLHVKLMGSDDAVAGFRRLAGERRTRVLNTLANASRRRKSA